MMTDTLTPIVRLRHRLATRQVSAQPDDATSDDVNSLLALHYSIADQLDGRFREALELIEREARNLQEIGAIRDVMTRHAQNVILILGLLAGLREQALQAGAVAVVSVEMIERSAAKAKRILQSVMKWPSRELPGPTADHGAIDKAISEHLAGKSLTPQEAVNAIS